MKKEYHFVPTRSYEASILPEQFADSVHIFYRSLFQRLFSLPAGANLTMPAEPGYLHNPPLHATQMWGYNHYNTLTITFAQTWNSYFQFTLLDVAELIDLPLRLRLADGRLKNGSRGYFLKTIAGYPEVLGRTGEFCVWHVLSGPNLCNKLFNLQPYSYRGGEVGDHNEKNDDTATA